MQSITHDRYGEPAAVLRLRQVADPAQPVGQEVLIRVAVRPVNIGTLLGVRGRYVPSGRKVTDAPLESPRLGIEGAGVVEAIGADVDGSLGLKPGTRVAFFPAPGSWDERVLVPAAAVTVIPDDLPFSIAAQLHLNPVTALSLLRAAEAAGAGLGSDGSAGSVVVDAAGSSVAKLFAAFARPTHMSIVGLVRRRATAALCADFSAIIASEDADWRRQLSDATQGRGFAVALDTVGGETGTALLDCLAPGGSLITYGDLSGEPLRINALTVAARDLHMRGVMYTAWTTSEAKQRAADVATFIALAQQHPELFPVAESYDLTDVARAVTHAEQPGKTGLVLLYS